MLKIAKEAVEEVIGGVIEREDLVDAEELDDRALSDLQIAIAKTGDAPFVKLALEQAIKSNQPEDYARFSYRFEDELEPLFRDMYERLFGALPESETPKIEYVSCWDRKESRSYRSETWHKLREDLYGLPPYDESTLRKLAV